MPALPPAAMLAALTTMCAAALLAAPLPAHAAPDAAVAPGNTVVEAPSTTEPTTSPSPAQDTTEPDVSDPNVIPMPSEPPVAEVPEEAAPDVPTPPAHELPSEEDTTVPEPLPDPHWPSAQRASLV